MARPGRAACHVWDGLPGGGGFGPGPLALFGLALLLALVLASMSGDFARLPFAMSWWGWTFPAAVFAVAAQGAARAWPGTWQAPVLWLFLPVASVIVAIVIAATSRAALRGHLFQPEG